MDDQQAVEAVVEQPDNDLGQIKQEALRALSPLINEIQDIEPERKFEICMSVMRFTDDRELARTALHAALDIADPSTKAQALVELVTEINYLQNN